MDRVFVLGGHGVPSPSLVSTGHRWLAYSADAHTLVVCTLKAGASECYGSMQDCDFILDTRLFPLSNEERLSVIHMHQTRDLLCVGTVRDGIYLTSASNPSLTSAASGRPTKLPTRLSGSCVLSACFIAGHADGTDILVASCGLQEATMDRSRLSLWDVCGRVLLWRGCAHGMTSIIPLPGTFGFVTCAQREVTLWFFRHCEPSGKAPAAGSVNNVLRGEESASGSITVLSKPCAAVKNLQDVEYVAVVPPKENESSLTALTTRGFLVSFDRHTGEPIRWMDCKMSPATAAYRCGDDIMVCGALIRFFSSETWEFRGKIKPPECRTSISTSSVPKLVDMACTGAAVSDATALTLLFSGGSMSRYRISRAHDAGIGISDGSTNGAVGMRLTFSRVYQYIPALPDELPLRWLSMSPESVCLWSPRQLRLYDTARWSCDVCMALESTCVTYHRFLGVFIAYEASTYAVVALRSNLESVLCRLSVTEPFTNIVVQEANRFVGISLDNSLFFFEGAWDEATQELSLRLLHIKRLTGHKSHFAHLVWVGGALCGASTHELVNLRTGHSISFAEDILSLTAAGPELLLLTHTHSCILLNATTLSPVGAPLRGVSLKGAVASMGGQSVALYSEDSVTLVSLRSREQVSQFSLQQVPDEVQRAEVKCVGFADSDRVLVVYDSKGLLRAFVVADADGASSSFTHPHSPGETKSTRLVREGSASSTASGKRAMQCDGPTNAELLSRFRDLHGFYETTRRSHNDRKSGNMSDGPSRRSCSVNTHSLPTIPAAPEPTTTTSSSGVLILSQGKSILQIPDGQALSEAVNGSSDVVQVEMAGISASCAADDKDGGVSASLVEISALTSVESKPHDLNCSAIPNADVRVAEISGTGFPLHEQGKGDGADAPAYGVRSPLRKGELSLSPIRTSEDDVVNIESLDRVERYSPARITHRVAHYDATAFAAPTTDVSSSCSSVRAKSLEIRDKLKELSEVYERQQESDVDGVDDETVEELYSTVVQLYSRLKLRRQGRSNKTSCSVNNTSDVSLSTVLADLQLLQQQNNRIEAQNRLILARLAQSGVQ
ncbi:hypothetical protein TRVL_03215 [Trypanosoma vivax]|nr:hypothetical protein TRVL_03215 [Trypanosoma vivax]